MPLKGAKTRLAALAAEGGPTAQGAGEAPDGALLDLPMEEIAPDLNQPRKTFDAAAHQALVESIRANGILSPIAVRPGPSGKKVKPWLIIAGERRWRAAKEAGLSRIPAIVRQGDPAVLALIENLIREDLNPIDEAQALARLKEDRGLTLADLAKIAGKQASTVSEIIKLDSLANSIKQRVRLGEQAPRRALVEIARIKDPAEQVGAFNAVSQGKATAESLRADREPQRAAKRGKPEAGPAEPERDTLTMNMFPEPAAGLSVEASRGRGAELRRAEIAEPGGQAQAPEPDEKGAAGMKGRRREQFLEHIEWATKYYKQKARTLTQSLKSGGVPADFCLEQLEEFLKEATTAHEKFRAVLGIGDPAALKFENTAISALCVAIEKAKETTAAPKSKACPEQSDDLRRAEAPERGGETPAQAQDLAEILQNILLARDKAITAYLRSEAWGSLRSALMRLQAAISDYIEEETERRAGHGA